MNAGTTRRWATSGVICAAVAASLPSCSHNKPVVATVTSVTVTGNPTTTVPGQTLQLAATANMSDGGTQNVTGVATWLSANTAVANVSPTGVVTGVALGDTSITARHMNVLGSLVVGIRALIARFVVSNAIAADQCRIVEGSGGRLDCTFNGAASLGSPTSWSWSGEVANQVFSSGPQTAPTFSPNPGCGFFTMNDVNKQPQIGTTGSVQIIVRLTVSKTGSVSETVANQNVRLFPQRQCGYGF